MSRTTLAHHPPATNSYRQEVFSIMKSVFDPVAPVGRALDFGSGDGWFADCFRQHGLAEEVVPVDVKRRERNFVEPILFDGARLPFEDRSFDLVYSVDVLHHCPDPRASLVDLLRCGDKYFLLKDHNYHRWPSWLLLCLLDEIGNRKFGIPCLYRHQRRWEWFPWIENEGFELIRLIHPAKCHTRFYDRAVNHYEFVALWQRK